MSKIVAPTYEQIRLETVRATKLLARLCTWPSGYKLWSGCGMGGLASHPTPSRYPWAFLICGMLGCAAVEGGGKRRAAMQWRPIQWVGSKNNHLTPCLVCRYGIGKMNG
jgi:hypothetical protein